VRVLSHLGHGSAGHDVDPGLPATAVITGATGFLGGALARRLARGGSRVLGVVRQPQRAPAEIMCVAGDVLDPGTWERVAEHLPSERRSLVVFHMAGMASVRGCDEDPRAAVTANLAAVGAVLDACRVLGIRRVVFPSSGLVYQPRRHRPLTENDVIAPPSIYAATKAAAERLLEGYAYAFGMSCDVARLSSAYGPRVSSESVVGTLLRQAVGCQPLQVRTGRPVRDFLFEEDAVEGLLALARRGGAPGLRVFNLSTGRGTSVRVLALTVARLLGRPLDFSEVQSTPESQTDRMVLANRRIRAWTGWRPRHSLASGLRRTLHDLQGTNA